MFIIHYIRAVVRRMTSQWLLTLIKLMSLTVGMVSFLIVWLFVIDPIWTEVPGEARIDLPWFYIVILCLIVLVNGFFYIKIVLSQNSLRYKELFIRKYYGESKTKLALLNLIDSFLHILIAVFISIVITDLLIPAFNKLTNLAVMLKYNELDIKFIIAMSGIIILCTICGLLPSIRLIRLHSGDIYDKMHN